MQVGLDRRVLSYITAELVKNLQVEEGGKYVGHLLAGSDSRLHGFGFEPDAPAMVITDFLPSGPNATRTAVELQPDGEYQEKLFRQIEQFDPEIEHIGTWHSHHCNGLQTLSSGDVAGYLRTVNKSAYRHDYFFASLVIRLPRNPEDQDWIDHYLFVRGDKEYYKINELVRRIDWPTKFGLVTGHTPDRLHARIPQPAREDRAPVPNATSREWYDTEEGRNVLAEDKRFFTHRFNRDVRATRRGRRIKLTGHVGEITLSIMYPADIGTSQVTILLCNGDTVILDINTNLQWRRLAMSAALSAAPELV